MTKIEALELELAARKMVEGTAVNWDEVIRWGHIQKVYKYTNGNGWTFNEPREEYELALGIVEGKPVWEGDKLYLDGTEVYASTMCNFDYLGFSWNPPKPPTVMVELPIATAKRYANGIASREDYEAQCEACRKALEELK